MKQHVLIIAEAGVNHNGDINIAKKLIDVASQAGADLVKFQTFKADRVASKNADAADYQRRNTASDISQYQMLKNLELSDSQHKELIAYAEKKNISFFSTAFDTEGLDYLNSLNFTRYKVPSGELTNYPYLRKLARFKKPVIVSTGMAMMEEVEAALTVLMSEGLPKSDITVLHCNTEYPTPMADVNLKAMLSMGEKCGVSIGYSDHTLGIEVPIAAVAMGAKVIEKHFTLNRNLPGPDHRASLEPSELKDMVKAIRNIEEAISGNGIKAPSKSELKNRDVARKSIHSAVTIEKDELLTEENIIPLRPGDGISPMRWNDVVGKRAARKIEAMTKLKEEDIKD